MKRIIFLLIVLASVVSLVHADAEKSDLKFKSSLANDAVTGCAASEAAAKAAYDKAMIAAKSKLIAQLEVAKNSATRAGDLDEAVKLQTKITAIKAEIDEIIAKPNLLPAGDWGVTIKGSHTDGFLTMRLAADGTATIGHPATKGSWKIDNGNLVISWKNGIIYTFTDRNNEAILGRSSENADLTAKRVKVNPDEDTK